MTEFFRISISYVIAVVFSGCPFHMHTYPNSHNNVKHCITWVDSLTSHYWKGHPLIWLTFLFQRAHYKRPGCAHPSSYEWRSARGSSQHGRPDRIPWRMGSFGWNAYTDICASRRTPWLYKQERLSKLQYASTGWRPWKVRYNAWVCAWKSCCCLVDEWLLS